MSNPRILIVEDHADLRKLMRFTLAGHGYDVSEAETGEEALRMIPEVDPDLVLLDVMLTGAVDGLEVCRAIKTSADTSSIRVVLLSARTQEADVEVGRAAGADDYMKKPFSPSKLLERVEEWLS